MPPFFVPIFLLAQHHSQMLVLLVSYGSEETNFTPHKNTMELTKSFPPIDDLIEFFNSINYRKHLEQLIMFTATAIAMIVAVSKFTYNRVSEWYSNGGKEQIQTITARCLQSINYHTGLIDKLSEQTIRINNKVENFYFYLSDVTVW